ncbi:hypothetical protein M409DRAFT_49718 [Zasmidium cellare ATCC 36951]|uniref:Uncharacterized protein n=1 Tax=Zasmidium cellare ATCC 36951 TaxID=1080233 RepID=A0A6A6D242_ZASCE|nr:uncharacterized protein M409DRAFT_49718 [Zasmidium cellare ATCC 36951]KAF2173245.1 hypothetical protein M409DRAFT_49718 [Zasmidium cellare ATCC 36951]
MHFQAFLLTTLIGLAASANIGRRATTCFDDGDYFFAGGKCVKASGQITGTCSGSTTTTATATATTSAPAASATGATCFDDGDCILSGGHCVKSGTGLDASARSRVLKDTNHHETLCDNE